MATEEDAMDTTDDPSLDIHIKQKRKFMGPFKKMKNFFRSRKHKSKDDGVTGVGMRTKSTNDMLRTPTDDDSDDEEGILYQKRKLSMSADSVFNPGAMDNRVRSTTIPVSRPNMARSMETVPQPGFQHELFRKLKNRRGGDEDEGLPQSPTQTTTADVIENGLKGPALSKSDNSLGSMDSLDEMDDGFFQSNWGSVAGSKRRIDNADDRHNSFDLDAVGSTSSLVSTSTRHRLAVKQQGKRASSKHHRPTRQVPSPVPNSLPEVEEEEPAQPEPQVIVEEVHSEEEESGSTSRSDVNSLEVVADVEPVPSPARSPSRSPALARAPTPVRTPTPEPTTPEPKVVAPKPEPVEEPKVEAKPAVIETLEPPTSDDAKKEDAPADDGKLFGGVVLRRTGKLAQIQDAGTLRRPNASRQDPSKRQTIAGDPSMFAERKVAVKEPKAKDDLHKPEVTDDTEDKPNTEFTAMFNRLRKQSSQKRILLEKEDTEEGKKVVPGGNILGKTDSKPAAVKLKPVVTAAKPTDKTSKATDNVTPEKAEKSPRTSVESTKLEEKKVEKVPSFREKKEEVKETVVIEKKPVLAAKTSAEEKKAALVAKTSGEEKKPVLVAKTSGEEKKPVLVASEEKKPVLVAKTSGEEKKPVLVAKTSGEEKKPTVEKTPEKKEVTPAKPAVADKKPVVEKKTITIVKPTTAEMKTPVPDKKTSESEKRTSGEKGESSSPTKENSLSTPPATDTGRSPVLRRVEPRKLPTSDSGNTGGEPAWIAMARRKTRDWDQKEKEIEQKDRKDSSNMAVKRDMIIDGKEEEQPSTDNRRSSRVFDLINNFQNSKVSLSN